MEVIQVILLTIMTLTSCHGDTSQSCDLDLINQCNCTFDQSKAMYDISCLSLGDITENIIQGNHSQPIKVSTLDLSANQITALSENIFDGIAEVSVLKLLNNSLTEFPSILSKKKFQLKEVFLSWNQLSEINVSQLQQFDELTILDLSHNNISKIVGTPIANSSTKIHRLDLSFNNIIQLDPSSLFSFDEVHSLDLTNNNLRTISHLFPRMNTKHLNLSYNLLSNIGDGCFQGLFNLQTLDLSHNKLQYVQQNWLIGLGRLEVLVLSNNNISNTDSILLTNIPQLHTLDLKHNIITEISWSKNTGKRYMLKTLDLSFNKIGSIKEHSFEELGHLTSLLLAGNSELSSLYQVRLPQHLAYLDLSNCSITELYECDMEPLVDLRFLHLQGNALSCDCHMTWLCDWWTRAMDTDLKQETMVTEPWKCNMDGKLVNFQDVAKEKFTCNTADHKNQFCTSSRSKQYRILNLNTTGTLTSEDIDLQMNSTTDGKIILSQWSVSPNHNIYGFKFTFSGSEEGVITSPWLHSSLRQYQMNDILSYTNYNVCVSAYHNETLIISQVCDSIYLISNKVYVGIMAGMVAIIPCIVILIIVIFKDRSAPKYDLLEPLEVTVQPPGKAEAPAVTASGSGVAAIVRKTELNPTVSKTSNVSSKDIESYINQTFAFADETSVQSLKSENGKNGRANETKVTVAINAKPSSLSQTNLPPDLTCCDQHENDDKSTKL